MLTAYGQPLTSENDFAWGIESHYPYNGVYYLTVDAGPFFSEGSPTDYAFRVLNASDPATAPLADIGAVVSGSFTKSR